MSDSVLHWIQNNPVVIDVSQPPARAARDISVDVVIGIFTMAGTFLLAAAAGSLLVAAAIVLLKRWRDAAPSVGHGSESAYTHTRLQI